MFSTKILKKNIYSWINTINREYFEVNTKYISSNVLKISVISPVRSTSENADIFNTRGEIFLVFTGKK